MKKLLKLFAIALAIGFCAVLTSSAPVSSSKITNEEICIDDKGIGCKVYKEGALVAKCFICNCANLADQYN